ncbi:Stromal Membrane-Associated Protein 1 [Manis pentadactyla]|nr:Stromal Membrane-Associated Protein 1 [Manis pentadactyla]
MNMPVYWKWRLFETKDGAFFETTERYRAVVEFCGVQCNFVDSCRIACTVKQYRYLVVSKQMQLSWVDWNATEHAMGPSYTEWNAMECGGMLPNGVQLSFIEWNVVEWNAKEYSGMYPKEVESCGMQCNRV